MRQVALSDPPFPVATASREFQWLYQAIVEIVNASNDQVTEEIGDAYTVDNLTTTRAIDCDTATTAQLADVVGTLLTDMKNRGVKRG